MSGLACLEFNIIGTPTERLAIAGETRKVDLLVEYKKSQNQLNHKYIGTLV